MSFSVRITYCGGSRSADFGSRGPLWDRRGVGDFGFQVKRPPMLRHVHVIGSYESYGCSIDTFQLTINVNVTLFV